MRIEDLRYFIRVAEAGSISQVAQTHYITQQGLSRIISSLEAELDVKLLDRGKNLRLTRAGKALLEDAKAIEASYLRMLDTAGAMSTRWSEAKGSIYTLYATPVICITILPRIIATLNQKFPGVFFNVLERLPLEILDGVARSEAPNPRSMGIFSIPDFLEHDSELIGSDEIRMEYLFSDELCIAVSDDSPLIGQDCISLEQLRDLHIVLHNSEYLMGQWLLGEDYAKASVTHTTNHMLCRDMVAQGGAVGLTSTLIQNAHRDSVVPVPLEKKVRIKYGCIHWRNEDPFMEEIAGVVRDTFRQVQFP